MNIRQIDLNLLVVFDALMSTRSVSRAAEKLFITQSALSQSLKRLRETLDDPVLVRSGNEMHPTERAKTMAPIVNRILRELEQVLTPPKAFDLASSKRSFWIRTSEYFECLIAPRLYEEISRTAPGVSIHLNYLEEEIIEPELLNQVTDIVVGLDQYIPVPKSLSCELLPKDTLVCMVSNKNPLQPPLSPEVYASQRHAHDHLVYFTDMANQKDKTLKDKSKGMDKGLKNEEKEPLRVESYLGLVRIIERTDYITTLPLLAAKHLLQHGDVRLLPAPPGLPEIQLNMVWHPLYDTDPGLQWLRNKIREIYTELLDQEKYVTQKH